MGFVDKVRMILEQNFPGAAIEVGRFHGAQRVNGYIIWDGFEDKEQIDRQREVRKALKDALQADVQEVSIILTYTPEEYETMAAA